MGRSLSGNITLPIRYEWIERCTPFLRQKHKIYTMRRKSVFFDVTSVAMLVTLCAGTLDATPSRQQNSTPQQALDKRQEAFQADKARGVHASYQWELSGPNGGEWWLIVNNGTYKTGRGKIDNPNVTFAASDEDWVAMSNKTLKISWAYSTGRLKIKGSPRLVRKLDEVFP